MRFDNLKDINEENKDEKFEAGYAHVLEMIEYLREQTMKYSLDMALAVKPGDIERHRKDGLISAVASVEEGGILNGKMERLSTLERHGVRMITLLWNHDNCIGSPNSRNKETMEKGLKPFGIEVIREMNAQNIIVDVSHASDGTFFDVLRYSKKPVVASHSNCRAITGHPRNLSDEMIKKLADAGGIAGLNFYGPFLGTKEESKIEEMVQHIKHMIRIGGSEFPAIGTDFDGFDGLDKLDILDISKIDRLFKELEKNGLSGSKIDKIRSQNALRVLREVC